MSYFRTRKAAAYNCSHHRNKSSIWQNTALLVVDVQRRYADPAYKERGSLKTHRTAQRIVKFLPQVRALGIQLYFVYLYREQMQENAHKPATCCGGFHLIKPSPNDILVPKTGASAIASSDLKQGLLNAGHRNLILVGFNSSACIKFTALDAKKLGFNVTVVQDLVENDKGNNKPKRIRLKTLSAKKIEVTVSTRIMNKLAK